MLLKILVIVFSRTGVTSKIANYIKEETNGDIYTITTPEDYSGVSGYLKGCYYQLAGKVPEIDSVPDIDQYDVIYIGGPTWAWKPAPPILKLLEKLDFKNKKVIPFLSSGGNYGSYFDVFAQNAKNANIVGQGAFRGAYKLSDDELKQKVADWVKNVENVENKPQKEL